MAPQSPCSRPNWIALLTLGLLLPTVTVAQESAAELEAAFRSGDSTRCMEAGNSLSDYKQLAAELAAPLFDVVEEDSTCTGNALSGLINLGRGIRDGLPAERAVPHLISLVEKGLPVPYGPPASQAESSVSLLGYFGEDASSAVPILERVVREREDEWSKRRALSALGNIGDPSASALFVEVLGPAEDESYERNELRYEAARSVGKLRGAGTQTAPVLVTLRGGEDWTLRSLAYDALIEIGPEAVPAILTELSLEDPERQAEAATMLARIGPDANAGAPALVPLLESGDWNAMYQASEALKSLGPNPEAIKALGQLLRKSDFEDGVVAAAEILGSYGAGAKKALPDLRAAIKRDIWSVTSAAKDAIETIEAAQ